MSNLWSPSSLPSFHPIMLHHATPSNKRSQRLITLVESWKKNYRIGSLVLYLFTSSPGLSISWVIHQLIRKFYTPLFFPRFLSCPLLNKGDYDRNHFFFSTPILERIHAETTVSFMLTVPKVLYVNEHGKDHME